MSSILIELQYLPSVAYFSAITIADKVIVEAKEFFEKQTFRNRCQIMTSSKKLNLTVPVHHQGKKVNIEDLKIDYIQKWQNNHWRSINTAYRKAPFFDYYADKFKQEIYGDYNTLFELNKNLLTICLDFLQIDTEVHFSKNYQKTPDLEIIDLRSVIHPKKDMSQITWFSPKPYYQIFGKDFVPNLSIIDLLLCEGPRAIEIIKESVVAKLNK